MFKYVRPMSPRTDAASRMRTALKRHLERLEDGSLADSGKPRKVLGIVATCMGTFRPYRFW
jgi:hypothetical protein